MNAVARKQAVRRDSDRVQCTVGIEHSDETLFDKLDPIRKAGSVAKLMFEPRNLWSDDGVRVVRGIRQFRHGDAKQPVEARWLEMNSEVVNASTDRKASPSVRLRTHHGDTWRGITVIRTRTADAVSVFERERQELLRSCRQRDNERDGADLSLSHAVCPDIRPQHLAGWRHFRLKHMCSPPRAVYQVSGSHAERIARRGKRVTPCATPRKVEITNALTKLRTSPTLPRCSRVTGNPSIIR